MEQGPVLQERGVALGPVLGIAGQTRLAVNIKGIQVSHLCYSLTKKCLALVSVFVTCINSMLASGKDQFRSQC